MKSLLSFVLLLGLLSACSVLPKAPAPLVQHDLGGGFKPLSRPALAVREIRVGASPWLAGYAMAYREADRPTSRGTYAMNRWAAPPAKLVEQALGRLLPLKPGAHCRLDVELEDAILELGADGKAAVLLSGSLNLLDEGQGRIAREFVDLREPVSRPSPAAEAEGVRRAVEALAAKASDWVEGEAGKPCR